MYDPCTHIFNTGLDNDNSEESTDAKEEIQPQGQDAEEEKNDPDNPDGDADEF